MIDVTLACGDANSKLGEVDTVGEVDSEKRVDDSLVQIWKLTFGHKIKFLSRLWHKIMKLKLRRDFEAEVWSVFCC